MGCIVAVGAGLVPAHVPGDHEGRPYTPVLRCDKLTPVCFIVIPVL